MTRFINKLLRQANLPLTSRQFWRYSIIFWVTLAVVSYIQNTLVWLISSNQKMHVSESLQWFITYLMWLGFTPVIFYAAQKFPIRLAGNNGSLASVLVGHILVSSAFGLLVSIVSYGLVRPLHAYETGLWIGPKTILFWFFYSYSLTVITYLLVVVGYSIISYTYQYQALKEKNLTYELTNEQLKTQLASAQLQSLKMQLNPHFLFNTHHAIVSLMLQNDTRKAIDMVTALSDMLRGVMTHQNDNFLSVRDELKLTQQYLSIQQIRFQDRLHIDYDIDPASESCPVPQLLLQPLVENAITHGIAGMVSDAIIRISTRKRVNNLQITVFDNGTGKRSKATKGTGLGLHNTQLRLRQAYGDAFQFTFDQPPVGHTIITITLPLSITSPSTANHANVSLAYH